LEFLETGIGVVEGSGRNVGSPVPQHNKQEGNFTNSLFTQCTLFMCLVIDTVGVLRSYGCLVELVGPTLQLEHLKEDCLWTLKE